MKVTIKTPVAIFVELLSIHESSVQHLKRGNKHT